MAQGGGMTLYEIAEIWDSAPLQWRSDVMSLMRSTSQGRAQLQWIQNYQQMDEADKQREASKPQSPAMQLATNIGGTVVGAAGAAYAAQAGIDAYQGLSAAAPTVAAETAAAVAPELTATAPEALDYGAAAYGQSSLGSGAAGGSGSGGAGGGAQVAEEVAAEQAPSLGASNILPIAGALYSGYRGAEHAYDTYQQDKPTGLQQATDLGTTAMLPGAASLAGQELSEQEIGAAAQAANTNRIMASDVPGQPGPGLVGLPAAANGAIGAYSLNNQMNGPGGSSGMGRQTLQGASSGAASGAAAGSIVPGVGNVVGGTLGAIYGGLSGLGQSMGLWGHSGNYRNELRRRALRNYLLENGVLTEDDQDRVLLDLPGAEQINLEDKGQNIANTDGTMRHAYDVDWGRGGNTDNQFAALTGIAHALGAGDQSEAAGGMFWNATGGDDAKINSLIDKYGGRNEIWNRLDQLAQSGDLDPGDADAYKNALDQVSGVGAYAKGGSAYKGLAGLSQAGK